TADAEADPAAMPREAVGPAIAHARLGAGVGRPERREGGVVVRDGDVIGVIVVPLQVGGGDRYALPEVPLDVGAIGREQCRDRGVPFFAVERGGAVRDGPGVVHAGGGRGAASRQKIVVGTRRSGGRRGEGGQQREPEWRAGEAARRGEVGARYHRVGPWVDP